MIYTAQSYSIEGTFKNNIELDFRVKSYFDDTLNKIVTVFEMAYIDRHFITFSRKIQLNLSKFIERELVKKFNLGFDLPKGGMIEIEMTKETWEEVLKASETTKKWCHASAYDPMELNY